MLACVTTFCPFCQRPNPVLEVDENKYREYRQGRMDAIEVVDGNRDKAEWLITGVCGSCWDRMFKEAEGEE